MCSLYYSSLRENEDQVYSVLSSELDRRRSVCAALLKQLKEKKVVKKVILYSCSFLEPYKERSQIKDGNDEESHKSCYS